jgi:phenylacetic acid degradation operon negative regulatory protein
VQPTAKSLILDLLSTLRGNAMPVKALIAAGTLFAIAENSIRVELARLTARGLVDRDERGQYRLARRAAAVQDRVAAWTRIDERLVDWSGGWIGAHTAALPRSPRSALTRRTRAFEFLGFRELEAALWIRPDNLRGGVAEIRRQLLALGLEGDAPVFVMSDLDPAAERRALALWDAAALNAQYRETRRAIEASARGVPAMPLEQAMVETFLLGGRAIRQLAFDPLLPERILPAAERDALIRTMQRYDRVGRQCWRSFMRTHGAPARRSPVNLRLVNADGDLPASAGSLQ